MIAMATRSSTRVKANGDLLTARSGGTLCFNARPSHNEFHFPEVPIEEKNGHRCLERLRGFNIDQALEDACPTGGDRYMAENPRADASVAVTLWLHSDNLNRVVKGVNDLKPHTELHADWLRSYVTHGILHDDGECFRRPNGRLSLKHTEFRQNYSQYGNHNS
jgi:hypothetical protein